MKIITIILVIIISIFAKTNAQIPNNGFENWHTIGSCIEPNGWCSMYDFVDSTGSYCPVTRSSDHYPLSIGNYSVRIANDTALARVENYLGWGCLVTGPLDLINPSVKPQFPIIGHPTKLCGYFKFFPQNEDTMVIYFILFLNGQQQTYGNLKSSITTSEWTAFEIPVHNPNYTSADSAEIFLQSSYISGNEVFPCIHGNSILYVDNISFDSLITTSVREETTDEIPNTFVLSQNYPNPFNPSTTISFALPIKSFVSLKIFDLIGREVITLVNEELSAGNHSQQWNAVNISSGIYYYRLRAGSFTDTKKLILLR